MPVLCGQAATPIASVAEAKRIDDRSCVVPQPFDLTGTVLSENRRSWFFRDGTGGLIIHNRRPEAFNATRGSTVRVRGNMSVEKSGDRLFLADPAEVVRPGRLASPVDATIPAILNGNMNFRLVRLRGVISSVVQDEVDEAFSWAELRSPEGRVYLTLHGKWNRAGELRFLLDAEVAVTGLAAPLTGLRRNLGVQVLISDHDAIEVIRRPPENPFAAPDLSDDRLFPHRQRVQGVVLAAEPRRFFLKTAVGRVIPVIPAPDQIPAPAAGELATAVGFTTDDPYRTQLSDALVRIDGQATNPLPRATALDLKSLFVTPQGAKRIETHVDGTVISVCGLVTSESPGMQKVTDGPYALSLDVATLDALGIPAPAEGCRVAVSGLCLVEFEHSTTPSIYPTFRRFVLIPRRTSDLTVLASPPWWTPRRLVMLLAAIAAVLLGSVLWNLFLNRRSEKRGRELYEERIDHALAEQKVEERTHLAVELHDSISQTLTGVALQLDGGEVETARAMLASCRGELRRCLWDLRSRTFEEKDLTEAIVRTITPHLNGCSAAVRFNVPRERLSESLTHAILRIIRELVVNAIRHGRAGRVKVAGETHGDTVSFSVTDDGIGFDPDRVPGPEQGHFGLLGIRERIEDFNGEIKIESAAGRGAKVTVTLTTPEQTNER